jgi:DNA-binding GntR family transcriptional regulator
LLEKRKSLGLQIYDQLLARLRRGEIRPGDRIVDAAVAIELGVSRTPVRDALSRLAHEGYLTGTSRGFILTDVSAEDAEEIFEMRKLLEPRAVASAARTLSEQALRDLEHAHRQAMTALAAEDVDAFIEAVRSFRNIWMEHVPNTRLADAVHRILAQTEPIQRRSFVQHSARLIVAASMSTLLDAFRNGDALAAHDTVASLIERGREVFVSITNIHEPGGGLS